MKGYCRQRTTSEILAELFGLIASSDACKMLFAGRGLSMPPPPPIMDEDEAAARVTLNCAKRKAYVRFEVVDFHGKAISKTVPARHAFDGGVFMYSGALAMGANAEVICFIPVIKDQPIIKPLDV